MRLTESVFYCSRPDHINSFLCLCFAVTRTVSLIQEVWGCWYKQAKDCSVNRAFLLWVAGSVCTDDACLSLQLWLEMYSHKQTGINSLYLLHSQSHAVVSMWPKMSLCVYWTLLYIRMSEKHWTYFQHSGICTAFGTGPCNAKPLMIYTGKGFKPVMGSQQPVTCFNEYTVTNLNSAVESVSRNCAYRDFDEAAEKFML